MNFITDVIAEAMYRLAILKDRAMVKTAMLLPRWLVLHAAIRVAIHASTDKYADTNMNELGAMTALQRWEDSGV